MINFKNDKTEFEFDEQRGRITRLNFCEKDFLLRPMPVFEIAERDENGVLSKTDTDSFALTDTGKTDTGFACVYENKGLRVKISAEIGDEIDWSIAIENNSDKVIEWVNFPQIVVKDDLTASGGNSKILWGFNEGALVDNLEFRNSSWGYIEPQYPSEGVMGLYPAIVELQCMAYYDNAGGLYFAAHDKDDNLKGIDFYEYDGGIKLEFRHFTGCDFRENYTMSYPMVMQFFNGDWQNAATIYRNWFEETKSEEFVPIEQNKKLPKWYSESPVIVTYPVRGLHDTDVMNPNKLFPYMNAAKHIERFEKLFDSKIMVILMHWEGTAPWAPPIVWPPYGGEEELRKFTEYLHERGDVLGVYCSGLGWTEKSNLTDYEMKKFFEENNLAEEMCLSPEQELPHSKICTDQRSGYDMCPTRKFTSDIICDQVKKMTDFGIDYIQLMDQNHGGTSYFCYSKKHDHPPVPGKWQVEAVKKLLDAAEKNAGEVLFGCESAAAQAYIPKLLFSDNRYNLCYTIGEPVPLYSFVYHKYLNNFMGNQVCTHAAFDHKKSPDNIFVRIAYSFCCGDMLTAVINEDGKIIFNWGYRGEELPDQDAVAELIKNLNYWRRGEFKKYLHSGVREIPYPVKSEKIKVYGARGFHHEYEKIFTCAWSSSDGSFCQFLVNHTDKPAECVLSLPENEVFKLYAVDAEPKEISGECRITVAGLSAAAVEKM